ncbi:response regulator [candidate division TA06 bacterium]|nr:response regulator [candidate division TA06 bacterium]
MMFHESDLKKIRSGVDIVEGQLGGLIAGKSYLIYGEPGTGKTMFGLQYLNEGLLQGERCGLVTQENPEDLLTMGRHIGFDWNEHLASGRLIIFRYLPNFTPHFSKSFDLPEIFNELQHLSAGAKVHRLVFDPITPIVDCVNRLNYTKIFSELFSLLEEMESTTLLTLDEISGVNSSMYLRTLISLSFGVFHLRISSDLKRKMFFQKMKYQSELLQTATYTIEPQKGIVSIAPEEKKSEGYETIKKKKILVADNDRKTCDDIEKILGDKYALTIVHDGVEAITKMVNNPLDLIILDTTLPKIDGFDLCRRFRSQGIHAPVLFISRERRRISDKIKGFNLGADGYTLKPLNLFEFELRVQAILRRGRDLNQGTLPSTEGYFEEFSQSPRRSSSQKRFSTSLSKVAFKKRVRKEIERSPSNFFTLVDFEFNGLDGKEGKKLVQICKRILVSEVREDDFVGNLGNGNVCIFLRGASSESSSIFIKRVKRKMRKEAREKLAGLCSSFKVKTLSATFPIDGKDAETILEMTFGKHSSKS